MRAMTRAMTKAGAAALIAGLAGCDATAPSCAEALDHAAAHLSYDDPLGPPREQRAAERFVPYDPRYTGSDVDFLVSACRDEAWSAAYRRCIAAVTKPVHLGRCDLEAGSAASDAWGRLPHVIAWRAAVDGVVRAAQARIHAEAEAKRKASSDLEAQRKSLPDYVDRAIDAQSAANAAADLELACRDAPLFEPECIAWMQKPSP
jgi:hypothetical protein